MQVLETFQEVINICMLISTVMWDIQNFDYVHYFTLSHAKIISQLLISQSQY